MRRYNYEKARDYRGSNILDTVSALLPYNDLCEDIGSIKNISLIIERQRLDVEACGGKDVVLVRVAGGTGELSVPPEAIY